MKPIEDEVIEALGLTVQEAAKILRVRRSTLTDLLHGQSALTPKLASRISGKFGPNAVHLLRMQLSRDNVQDVLVDQICLELEEIGACYWRMHNCWKALDPDKHVLLRKKFFDHFLTNTGKSFLGRTKALVASWRSKPRPEGIPLRTLRSHQETKQLHRKLGL